MSAHVDHGEADPSPITATATGSLSSKDVHRLASFLALAFEWDPMQCWLFPRDDRRKSQIAEMMARDLTYRIAAETTVLSGARGQAVVFVEPRTAPVRSVRAWRVAPAFASLVGPRALVAWKLLRRLDGAHAAVGPHLYVVHLAVAPADRRRGHASALLERVGADADPQGLGVYLETANPDAVPLYERHGFAVRQVIRQGAAPPVWVLWRPPPGAGVTGSACP